MSLIKFPSCLIECIMESIIQLDVTLPVCVNLRTSLKETQMLLYFRKRLKRYLFVTSTVANETEVILTEIL